MVKSLIANAGGLRVPHSIPGSERSHEEETVTHSSALACKISQTEVPAGYSPGGCKELGMTECARTHTHTHTHTHKVRLQLFLTQETPESEASIEYYSQQLHESEELMKFCVSYLSPESHKTTTKGLVEICPCSRQ